MGFRLQNNRADSYLIQTQGESIDMPSLTLEARLPDPTNQNEQTCQVCGREATSVLNGIAECNEHAGMRLLSGENPEIIGAMVVDYLRRQLPSTRFNENGVGSTFFLG